MGGGLLRRFAKDYSMERNDGGWFSRTRNRFFSGNTNHLDAIIERLNMGEKGKLIRLINDYYHELHDSGKSLLEAKFYDKMCVGPILSAKPTLKIAKLEAQNKIAQNNENIDGERFGD